MTWVIYARLTAQNRAADLAALRTKFAGNVLIKTDFASNFALTLNLDHFPRI